MKIKDANSCKYDLVSLGESMLRLSPPQHGRIEFAPMLDFFESTIGPYPFGDEKMGVVETPHKGMEHQTVNAYGNKYAKTAYGYDELLQHEFAHEWFGNQLTNANWDDMWLHEGLGSYMQPLYMQHLRGNQEYFASLMQQRAGIEMVHVAYTGNANAVNAAIGGFIDVVVSGASVVKPNADAGALRPLAVAEYNFVDRPYGDAPQFAKYKKLTSYAGNTFTRNWVVNEKEHPTTGTPYAWVRARVLGGKTNFWGRGALRYGPQQFKAASLDGFDVDWPIDYTQKQTALTPRPSN